MIEPINGVTINGALAEVPAGTVILTGQVYVPSATAPPYPLGGV